MKLNQHSKQGGQNRVYRSVLHNDCGGEIVLVASGSNDAVLCCRSCKQTWETSTNYVPFPQVMSVGEDMYIQGDL